MGVDEFVCNNLGVHELGLAKSDQGLCPKTRKSILDCGLDLNLMQRGSLPKNGSGDNL